MKKLILISLITVFLSNQLFSQDSLVKEWREVKDFNSVSVYGPFEVYIIQNPVFEITIEAENSVLPNIDMTVKESTLNISTVGYKKLNNILPVKIYIKMPEVKQLRLAGSGIIKSIGLKADRLSLELIGSGNIYIDDLAASILGMSSAGTGKIDIDVNAEAVKATIIGSGNIVVSGNCNSSDFSISGTGCIYADSLAQDECIAQILGTGDINTTANKYLDAELIGTGRVYYHGNPELKLTTLGTGRLIKKNN